MSPNSIATSSPSAESGVAAARVCYAANDKGLIRGKPPTISDEFRLDGRACLVTGANGGLGLEIALVLAELGAKVWGVDLSHSASEDFKACAYYAEALHQANAPKGKTALDTKRLVYRQADVTDQEAIKKVCHEIVATDGSLDVCVAAAGILPPQKSCLDISAAEFERVMKVNSTGVFNTGTAAAAEMEKLDIPGSIILIASMSGSATNRDHHWIAYNTSKAAVLQMARSMACELGPHKIRVNTISPGHIRTAMTAKYLDANPELEAKWSSSNPLGRIGKPHEIRGVAAWLASDASTFCTGSDIIVAGGHLAW